MLVMGIDSSTTATGYCLLDKEANKIVSSGVIRPDNKLSTLERIIYTQRQIIDLNRQFEPEKIFIEEMAVIRNAKTMRALIGLEYLLLISLYKDGAVVEVVRPTEWRKDKIKGKGREQLKAKAIEYVKNKYGISVSDDEADSIIIAEYEEEVKTNGKKDRKKRKRGGSKARTSRTRAIRSKQQDK